MIGPSVDLCLLRSRAPFYWDGLESTRPGYDSEQAAAHEYRAYVGSFVRVLDDRIDGFVSSRLDEGELWPDAVLQLNPPLEMDRTLRELSDNGLIRTQTARFFGEDLGRRRHKLHACRS